MRSATQSCSAVESGIAGGGEAKYGERLWCLPGACPPPGAPTPPGDGRVRCSTPGSARVPVASREVVRGPRHANSRTINPNDCSNWVSIWPCSSPSWRSRDATVTAAVASDIGRPDGITSEILTGGAANGLNRLRQLGSAGPWDRCHRVNRWGRPGPGDQNGVGDTTSWSRAPYLKRVGHDVRAG